MTGRAKSAGTRGAEDWARKFANAPPPVVKPAPIDIAGMKAGELMLVPSPSAVAAAIDAIPAGTAMDVRSLRRELARAFGAEVTCPITTGFHLRTVAEVACQAHRAGAALDTVTPFWRVLDETTPTAAKLSCGLDFIRAQRQREGLDAVAAKPRRSAGAMTGRR